ncbi:ribosomal protein L22e [Alternaria panax]|uniref:Ribosomal protein L22e n=1 Tax=Alternaria panax TaxID=48097 RepID=A0AAD4IB21_9PLEO|nr:ribosomal protein L22e [Alternaria panax]
MSFREFIDTSRGYKLARLYGRDVPWTYLGEPRNVDLGMDDDLQPTSERILLKEFCKPTQSIPDGISCFVCMADVDKSNKDEKHPVLTKCNHYFHEVCLDKWVNDSGMGGANACPSCRAEICQARARVPVSELEEVTAEPENGLIMKRSTAAKKGQKVTKKFIINCSQPVNDKIFDIQAFEKFLHDRIKVEGRTGNLGDTIQISQQGDGKIEVIAHQEFSGRYLKYLTKKFLKKQQLRDWLRVVSTSKGVYELRFFNVVNDEADEDDE